MKNHQGREDKKKKKKSDPSPKRSETRVKAAGSHREKYVSRMKSRGTCRLICQAAQERSTQLAQISTRHHQEGRWQLRGLSLLSLSYSRPLWLLAQSTLDGSLLFGSNGVSSVARQEAKTGGQWEEASRERREREARDGQRERHTERRERWIRAEAGGRQKIELSAWFAGHKDRKKRQNRGRRGCGRGSRGR